MLTAFFWSFGIILGEIPTGVLADKIGAKKSFFIGVLMSIASLLILIIARSSYLFYFSNMISGIAATFFSGSDEALIFNSLKAEGKEREMEKSLGIIHSSEFLISIFSLVAGSLIARNLADNEFTLLIILTILGQCIKMILLLFIRDVRPAKEDADQQGKITAGLATIRKNPSILLMFLNVTLVFIPSFVLFGKFQDKLLVEAGLPPYLLGFLLSLMAVLGFTASFNISRITKKFGSFQVLRFTGYLACASLLATAFTYQSLTAFILIMAMLKFSTALRYPIYSQISNQVFDDHSRATTISLLSVADSICDLILYSLSAWIISFGFTPYFLFAFAAALLGVCMPIRKKES